MKRRQLQAGRPINQPLTKDQVAEKFEKYRRMACSIAIGIAAKHNLSPDELVDEALSILGLALTDHWVCYADAGESTWVYKNVYWPLLTYATRTRHKSIPFSSFETDDETFDAPSKPTPIQNLIRHLGDEAKVMVDVIVNAPIEIAEDVTSISRRRARKAIVNYLASTEGWHGFQIRAAWDEVKAALE